ncbi:DUF4747 domain-containing protein [Duncaniella muris]|uniref:DUF4747 domain-containing protein n=1 Tax=Duncaniella muris TaxID=2094150 RepID=A0A2V1IKU6_9BACT|nr:DUF4747 family protein [Duncaniella muris]PWB03248.1 DUF4747 domain-containing protein [Duncaniella muris]
MKTSWYILNIKARTNQTPSHYVECLRNLKAQDPLVTVAKDKCVSIWSIEESIENTNGIPSWMIIKIISYTIIDPTKFYNRRSKENLELQWDSDVVANKKETELFFIPACHKLATRKNSKITLNYVKKYLEEALNQVESESFDVNIVVSQDLIRKIKDAFAVVRIRADISFSNPGHSDGFARVLDEKLRAANPDKALVELIGSKTTPLGNQSDGLVSAITDIAEQDGTIEATIQSEEGGIYEKVSSSTYPRIVSVIQSKASEAWGAVYNAIREIFPTDD